MAAVLARLGVALAVLAGINAACFAQSPSLVAPPRTIADIAAILDQEKPDPARIASQQAKANAAAPSTSDKRELARFHLERGEMRGRLGRLREAIADLELAIDEAEGTDALLSRALVLLGQLYGWSGDPKNSLAAFRRAEPYTRADRRYNVTRWIGIDLIFLGDLDAAERMMQRNRDLIAEAQKQPGWSTNPFRSSAEAHVEFGNAAILEARGQFREAAAAYERAELAFRDSLTRLSEIPNPPIRSSIEQVCEWMVARAARAKAREGRLAEAEIDVRRALLGWLKLSSKYDLNTVRIIDSFALILVEQARFAEAETLERTVIDIYKALGAENDSQLVAVAVNRLGGILALQGKWAEAAKTYAALDDATKDWDATRKDEIALDVTRIFTAYNTNDVNTGVAAAERLVARQASRFGERHPETALARGILGIGLARAGRDAQAFDMFQAAAPILITTSHTGEGSDDDAVSTATRAQRVQAVIESYLALLAARGRDGIAEGFRMAEAIRGRSVQQALAASSARAVVGNPALAELARNEQDLGKQISAQLGILNNLLALPPSQRDEKVIRETRVQIESLQRDHEEARAELAQRFPDYAELISPQPPTATSVQDALRTGETLLSFYFGHETSYVWAVPKQGPVAFAEIRLSSAAIEKKIARLREALEPNAATIADIPPFDLSLAHELYALLLQPVESGWKPAKSLIVATNGALGLLPLGLLPTAASDVKGGEPLFAAYQNVPWLARTHAVTMVPSAAALRTLRALPPGKPGRDKLIAFGDPLFSKEQAQEVEKSIQVADASTVMRGVPLTRRSSPRLEGVDSAELAMLPRLPDTADELRAIAIALDADPAKVLNLGKDANEAKVKSLDLSGFKIVAFATHGLVPGELNGLTQPALALSAPDVSGTEGDGLLTMEEILALKLDADWVVLSACNTASGAGPGAEAASGLGRAFFYAGTRAILVTNWSVHSASARELVSDLFRRQTADVSLTRAEALRQATMALIDGPGFTDENGKTLFSYAHPLFWAPYSIFGDGG